jgi:hypothetical protein
MANQLRMELEIEVEDFREHKTQSRVACALGWNGTVPNSPEMKYSLILSRPVDLRNNDWKFNKNIVHASAPLSCPSFSEQIGL